MDKIQNAVELALRETEACTAVAELRDISMRSSSQDDRRVLAVVTHNYLTAGPSSSYAATVEHNSGEGEEEGCLFVLKYKSPSSPELYPYLLFPIDSDLSVSLQQRGGPEGTEFEVSLKILRGSILLGSDYMPTLSAVLEETRRLKKLNDPNSRLISPTPPSSPQENDNHKNQDDSSLATDVDLNSTGKNAEDVEERHWEWLHFYLSHRSNRTLPSQRPKPRDIRPLVNGYKLSPSSAGLPGDEDGDIALIRDQWVNQQLSARKDEYSQRRSLRLRIGTFNVNGKLPSQSLVPWIWASASQLDSIHEKINSCQDGDPPGPESEDAPISQGSNNDQDGPPPVQTSDSSSVATSTVTSLLTLQASDTLDSSTTAPSFIPDRYEDLPDIFVLGFQELDLSTEALLYSTSTVKEDTWVTAIFAALGQAADDYVKLASRQLVGVLVVVIVRKEIRKDVKEVSSSAAGVGLMGIMGNKGATAIRLHLYSTIVTFVCSHLAAFDEFVDKRNSDFAELARKLEFPIKWKGTRNTRPLNANIWETDMLFWLGDLNYRIDLPDDEVRTLLNCEPRGNENFTLLGYDQLKMASRHKRAFVGFTEHHIDFLPTYRFNEALRDDLGYDLKRKPAWTDRILYMSADPTMISQKSYRSHPTITLSDHQPVSANFEILLEDHDPHQYHRVARSIFKTLGDFEDSDQAPTVTRIDDSDAEVDLGKVSYLHPVLRCVRVKNEGKIPCAFRFVPLEPGAPICKEWLQVRPTDGILLPGETASIYITVNVDKRTASFLNHGNTRLEDNLILHIAKGTDHLISVSGLYQPTCFANSLAWLVRSSGPIRTQGNASLLPEANTLSAPRELMFLVEWLITNAQDVSDLFVSPAEVDLVSLIREHLDTQHLDSAMSITFPAGADHREIALAFGQALLQFLESLSEPVIPWVLHPRCASAQSREDAFEILDDVPGFARNVYVTVTAFLHFIAQSGGAERSVALARVFADVLLRDNPRAPPGIPPLTPLGKRRFLLYTIA